ncbi:MAG: hypothetical protein M0Q95_07880 [Porticoccaceae bacterium]|jgi:hypothetical protein|nr:hypothetical protein [Porticoccaceae bacterium]
MSITSFGDRGDGCTAAIASAFWLGAKSLVLTCMLFGPQSQAEVSGPALPTDDSRIGLVLGYWNIALYQTVDGKEECPEGFHHTQGDNFRAQFPTQEARDEMLKKYAYYTHRGPQGENVFYHPTVIKDPLPLREIQGKTALGLNLDGKVGESSFTSPDGEEGIDNQLYRVVGCIPGWREGGMAVGVLNREVRASHKPRVLIEITGVDDEKNDDNVTVMLYRGLDPVEGGPDGKLIPFRSQRVDTVEGKRFIHQLQGRIVDGVLHTEPEDIRLPDYEQVGMPGETLIRDARFRLALSPTGAEGLLGGYTDVERWYLMFAKTWGAHFIADVIGWSGPATYEGLKRLADGHPDDSGRFTTISSAYKVGFARTFIIHSQEQQGIGKEPQMADGSSE